MLRNDYAPALGKRLGRVILSTKEKEFLEKVEDLRERIVTYCKDERDQLQTSIETSIQSLASNLAPLVYQRPPKQLAGRCEDLTVEVCEDYLLDVLRKVAPSAPELLENTKLHVTFKDVTLEMLQNREFQQRVKQEFKYESWAAPFSKFTAAGSADSTKDDK